MSRWFFWIFVLGEALIISSAVFLTYGQALPVSDSKMAKAVDRITLNLEQTGVDPVEQMRQNEKTAVGKILHESAWFVAVLAAVFFVVLYAVRRHSAKVVDHNVSTLLTSGRPRGDNSVVGQTYRINPDEYRGSIQDRIDRL